MECEHCENDTGPGDHHPSGSMYQRFCSRACQLCEGAGECANICRAGSGNPLDYPEQYEDAVLSPGLYVWRKRPRGAVTRTLWFRMRVTLEQNPLPAGKEKLRSWYKNHEIRGPVPEEWDAVLEETGRLPYTC